MLHFRCPSPFRDIRLNAELAASASPDTLSDELNILDQLHNITGKFTSEPRTSAIFPESLIPDPMQVETVDSDISINSAILYTALHPIFTSEDILSRGTFEEPLLKLFEIVAKSASILVDHFILLDKDHKIISIWMAAERVFEAGLVWVVYLMSRYRTTHTLGHTPFSMDVRNVMGPILKVSSLLGSFRARWKLGSAYVDAWETIVELLWDML